MTPRNTLLSGMHSDVITSTHVVTSALLVRRWPGRFVHPTAFVVGGLAPDVGLTVMTAGAAILFPRTRGWSRAEALRHVFDTLFFESKPWIAASNMLHAPIVVGVLSVIGRRSSLGSFAAGCALHVAMDVPVHHDDGPVLAWPLNWTYRFRSPLSYWDRDHHANIVAPIDLAITIIGGALLLRDRLATA